jgi:hypothetical protein
MRIRRLWIVLLAASTVLAGVGGPAAASADHAIAVWEMNEPAGSRVMRDISGNGLDGTIGSEVGSSVIAGARGYHFDRLQPDTPPTHPRHLVTVRDSSVLDPGTRDYAVSLRLRTTDYFGNIIQKGQATVAGGSFKLQIPNGHVQCWFRGSSGSLLVTAPSPINDGGWHVVHCERTGQGVALTIDGRTVATKNGRTGSIANSWPLSIGGKTVCDQISVGCDYFPGDIDWVEIDSTGSSSGHDSGHDSANGSGNGSGNNSGDDSWDDPWGGFW